MGRTSFSAMLSVWNSDFAGAATVLGVPTLAKSSGVVSSKCKVA
jgi:hypothetical protein